MAAARLHQHLDALGPARELAGAAGWDTADLGRRRWEDLEDSLWAIRRSGAVEGGRSRAQRSQASSWVSGLFSRRASPDLARLRPPSPALISTPSSSSTSPAATRSRH